MKLSVHHEDFDLPLEAAGGKKNNPKTGAGGESGGGVRGGAMTLEHYRGMPEKALEKIVAEAGSRWQVIDCTVIHRHGELRPGDQIVLVAVASAHRGDAFAACEFIMDYLKTQAPFWKKEHGPQGARWVEARSSDDDAAGRWQDPARKAG